MDIVLFGLLFGLLAPLGDLGEPRRVTILFPPQMLS